MNIMRLILEMVHGNKTSAVGDRLHKMCILRDIRRMARHMIQASVILWVQASLRSEGSKTGGRRGMLWPLCSSCGMYVACGSQRLRRIHEFVGTFIILFPVDLAC
jgi:hypothetical protein